MLPEGADHAACVEAWLDQAGKNLPPVQLVTLFERAMGALWRRAHFTLGEVTLTAIFDRVLYTASEKYSFLSMVKIDGAAIRFDEFRRQAAVQHGQELPDVVRLVLVEFLTVLGNLTDEILTPALHAELRKVELEGSGHAAGDDDDEVEGAAS